MTARATVTADLAKIKIIESVFSTGKRQDDRILRCLFYKFCIIVSSGSRTITSAHEEEMADLAGFYSVNYRICNT